MNIMHLTPDLIRGARNTKVLTGTQQDHLEVRLLSIFATWAFLNGIVGPITYLYQLAPSILYRVAALSQVPQLVLASFIVAGLLMLPHAVALVFFPKTLYVRWPRKCATASAALVAVNWAYLAVLAQPIDSELSLFWLYGRNMVESLGMAFLFAMSLNAQLVRIVYALMSPEPTHPRRRSNDA